MDTIVHYEQVPGLGTMDTSTASAEIMPTFLSNTSQDILQTYILDQPKQESPASSVVPQLHMPTVPRMSIPAFLDTPMDAVQVPSEPFLPSAGYVPVDPFAMLQHTDKVDLSPDAMSAQEATILSTASAFGGIVAPLPLEALEAVLDSNNAVGRRSRGSTSLSPQSIPSNFPSLSPPRLQPTPTLDYSSAASNSSADEDVQTPPRAVIGKMLRE